MIARLLAGVALLTALAGGAGGAERPWRIIRGRSVAVVGQQSPKTLRRVAVEIEQFRMALGAIVPAARQPLPVPTVVYTFDDKKAMEPFVPLYQGKPASVGGYCHCGSTSDINFIVANLASFDDASRLIYHEYTHLIVHNFIRHVPIWLGEGLAEYYSTFRLVNGEKTAEVGRPIAYHIEALAAQSLPIAEMLAVDQTSSLYNEGNRRGIFYAEAWALTHYLMNGRKGGAAAITAYLNAVAAGESSAAAFTAAFGASSVEMEKELRTYLQRYTYPAFSITLPARVEVDEPEKAYDLSPADASARLGGVQLRIGRVDEGARRIEAAAASEPRSAEAQLTLALLRVHQVRSDEALTAVQEAAALAPDDFLTQYSYGLLLLRRQIGHQELPADGLNRAHDAMARAAAANPQSTEALAWLAFANLAARTRLDEAQSAIQKAIDLSPRRPDLRLRLAEVLIARGEEAVARPLLTALTAVKTDQDVADHARGLLEQLDAVERQRAERAARRAAIALAAPRADVDPPEVPREFNPGRITLRTVRAGEQRAYGMLTAIECSPTLVRLHLAVGARTVIATAGRMEDVELTRFTDETAATLTCGPRTPPEAVYLTWRMLRAPAGGAVVGTAVAVEFVPLGYIP